MRLPTYLFNFKEFIILFRVYVRIWVPTIPIG